jgi:hypothetical protein
LMLLGVGRGRSGVDEFCFIGELFLFLFCCTFIGWGY